ncbi:MAG: RNA polymerase sigma factor [Planctomycetota bacterium]
MDPNDRPEDGFYPEDEPSDVDLMLAVRDGNTDAFAWIVARHHDRLVRFFWRNMSDRSLAEDFTQEVLIKLYRAAERYTPQARFTTFLYRIATNYLIDHYRSAAVRPTSLSLYGGAPGDPDGESRLVDNLESRPSAPEEGMLRSEMEERIQRAVAQLPSEQRLVFTMSEIDGMKYQDIAEALDIPLGTVKSRMHTAFQRLRDLLRDLAPWASPATSDVGDSAGAGGSGVSGGPGGEDVGDATSLTA